MTGRIALHDEHKRAMQRGNTILLAAWGFRADLMPVLAIAAALRRRGLRVVLAAPAAHAPLAASAGIAFAPLRPELPAAPAAQRRLLAGDRMWRRLMAGLSDSVADLGAAVATGELAAVVAHPAMPAAAALAERADVPWLALAPSPSALADVGGPPTSAAPSGFLAGLGSWLVRRRSRPLADLRRRLGLPVAPAPAGILALFPELLCPPHPDLPAGTVYTGFVAPPAALARPVPPELTDFLHGGAPPLVFTLGETAPGLAGDFYRVAMAAAAALGRRALLLTGGDAVLGAPPSAAVGVFAEAPAAAVLPSAAAVVHQAEIGVVAAGLRAGRPMLAVPRVLDQPDNARRCRDLGVAAVLPPGRYRPAPLARALDALLSDRGRAARAAELARSLAGGDGAERAAAIIAHVAIGGGLHPTDALVSSPSAPLRAANDA